MNADIEADGAALVVVAQSSILNERRTYESQNERQSWRNHGRVKTPGFFSTRFVRRETINRLIFYRRTFAQN
jgi:hypothetical protein